MALDRIRVRHCGNTPAAIRQVKYNGISIPLPRIGTLGGKLSADGTRTDLAKIVEVRTIGNARRGLHLGQFLGTIQVFEMILKPLS